MRQIVGLVGLTVSLGIAACAQEPAVPEHAPFVIAGYLPSYRLKSWPIKQAGLLTDVIYFHVIPTERGEIEQTAFDAFTRERLSEIQRRSTCELALTIGGWGHSDRLATVCSDPDRRNRLVESVRLICKETAVRNIDFDWEYPANERQWKNLTTIIRQVQEAIAPTGGRCSAAISPWKEAPKSFFEAVDRVHMMSYDHDYPHATLEKTQADIDRVLAWGCPPRKLIVGVPFYGRGQDWTATTYRKLVETSETGNGDLTSQGVAYNGPATVRAKVRLARQRGLGGVMIWEVGQDAEAEEHSLLAAIHDEATRPNSE